MLCLYNFIMITKTSNLEGHNNNIIFRESKNPKHLFQDSKGECFGGTFSSWLLQCSFHLKVHGHSSIGSLLSDQGDWHNMVSSSQLIDYNLISLQSKQLTIQPFCLIHVIFPSLSVNYSWDVMDGCFIPLIPIFTFSCGVFCNLEKFSNEEKY